MWETFLAFERHYKPRFVMSEFTVWSDTYGYAGTGDLAFYLGDSLVLADTKTGKNVYWDTGLQLAAINGADFIINEQGQETPIPKFDRFAVLHIRPTQFKLVPMDNIDQCFQCFLGLKTSFDTEMNFSDSVMGYAPTIKAKTVA
jgi:hypothetical protein